MSSRNRRKQIQEESNLLTSDPNQLDAKTADAIGFGGLGDLAVDIAAADLEYQAIEAVSIFDIVPNAIQPRYAIPHVISDIYTIKSDNMVDIFTRWVEEVQLERKQEFDIQAYLLGDQTLRGEQAEAPEEELPAISTTSISNLEKSLMKIVDLAASIRRDGLSNPVSLVRHDGFYEIETGERRWLAYHLLRWQFGEADIITEGHKRNWSRIPSRIVKRVDVWRQASENNARDNLNAISKARQLAVLLMDLHGWQNFAHYDEYEDEQDFYAQVADGNQWRIPRGAGEKLLNAMGLSNAGQLRQYRALLRLPSDEWRRGDDENLTEGELRKILSQLDTVTPVTVSTSKTQQNPVNKLATDANQWRNKLRHQITTDPTTRNELKNLIEDEIKQLQQLMDELDNLD
jgi:ParB-like chromosome segregation protein Spo0J